MKLQLFTAVSVLATSTLCAYGQEVGVTAAPAPAETNAPESTIASNLSGGYVHFFDASFGSGTTGTVSENRLYASYKCGGDLNEDANWGLGFNYTGAWYNFSGATPLDPAPGVEPWGAVTSLMISPALDVKINERWNAFGRVFVDFSGESNADAWNSTTGGGAIGASYSFNKDLTLGLGVLGASQIEDNALVIPLLIVNWKISDALRVTNVAGPSAYPTSNGLEIVWRMNEKFELSFGGRWELDRFRLDDDATNPNGVGQDQGLPIWIRGTFFATKNARIDLLGGVRIGSEFNLYDQNGNGLTSSDVDAQPFLGVFASFAF